MNSEILYITRRLGFPASFGMRSGLGDFLEQYPDGIYAETGVGAPIGWESAAVWFGGASERAAARFESMVAERNDVSRLFRTRVSGVFLLTFLYRLKKRAVTAVPVGGGTPPTPPPSPIDEWWGLKLTMPEGGTVILRKNGSPNAVNLEVSTDAVNWSAWELVGTDYSYTLAAGQTLCIRNTSETAVGLGVNMSNYYGFVLSDNTIANGKLISLLIKEESDISLSAMPYCLANIFLNCTKLLSMPELSGITKYGLAALRSAFQGCTSLAETTILPNAISEQRALQNIFAYCYNLKVVKTNMTDISASNFISNWLNGVAATGDFYCPAELTIPTGASGIPSGWTRHDI